MSLLDAFKKKEVPAKAASVKAKPKTQKPKPLKEKKEVVAAVAPRPKKISGEAYKTLKSLHVTEKAGDLTAENQYVLEVFTESNKIQIKKAVEDLYGVDVVNVHIINMPRKKRRLGRTVGWSKGGKKAIVRIKEGQKIEVLSR